MREALHRVLAAFCWAVLVGLWILLVDRHRVSGPTIAYSLGYLAVVSGVVLAVTAWWIRHNVDIYRRKGPRRGRMELPPRIDEDRLGRPLCWRMPGGVPTARSSNHLVLELDGPVKVYRRA